MNEETPKTIREIDALINSTVTHAIVITSEQRLKDKIEGWNECYKTVYEWFEKRYGVKEAEIFKQFEYKGSVGTNSDQE